MSKAKKTIPYVIICFFSLIVFLVPFGNGDELWNYNFARNISVGLKPYKDFSIVQTPLSSYIAASFIKIFGEGMFSVRIAGYILFSAISCLTFKIISFSENKMIVLVTMIFSMSLLTLPFIYNYNYLSALIVLIIIRIEQINKKNRNIISFIVGFLVGMTPLIKQNTGLFLWLGNVVICLLYLLTKKCDLKTIIIRLISSILPIIFFLGFLILTGTFNDFYDYAIKGIQTFTNRFTPIDLFIETPVFGVLFIILAVFIIKMFVKAIKIRTQLSQEQLSGLVMSIAWCSVAFPLCDGSHVLCVAIPVVPTYILFFSGKQTSTLENYFCIFVASLVGAISIIYSLPIRDDYHFSTVRHYEYLLITDTFEIPIIETDNYIKQKVSEGYRVRIADDSAAAFNIPLDRYEKNWDMLLIGNLGSNTIADLLDEDKKTLYLVSPREHDGLQECKELISYIQNNYKKIDHIGCFDVYEK